MDAEFDGEACGGGTSEGERRAECAAQRAAQLLHGALCFGRLHLEPVEVVLRALEVAVVVVGADNDLDALAAAAYCHGLSLLLASSTARSQAS